MKELIKEAEKLYEKIDKAQVHLINARLNNDEEGKKSAISEMETAMCNAMQLLKCYIERNNKEQNSDSVNHPAHYTWLKELCGIEVIDITRHMNFNLGQVLKYILRLGHKEDNNFTYYEKILSDLHKAEYYLKKEIIKIDELCKKNGNH